MHPKAVSIPLLTHIRPHAIIKDPNVAITTARVNVGYGIPCLHLSHPSDYTQVIAKLQDKLRKVSIVSVFLFGWRDTIFCRLIVI